MGDRKGKNCDSVFFLPTSIHSVCVCVRVFLSQDTPTESPSPSTYTSIIHSGLLHPVRDPHERGHSSFGQEESRSPFTQRNSSSQQRYQKPLCFSSRRNRKHRLKPQSRPSQFSIFLYSFPMQSMRACCLP